MKVKIYYSLMIILISVAIISGCVSSKNEENLQEQKSIEKLNLTIQAYCGSVDKIQDVTLWSTYKRGEEGLAEGIKVTGKIPTCQKVELDVLKRICSNEIEYDLIRYGSVVGWITRRLLTCPDNVHCDRAPDTICEY